MNSLEAQAYRVLVAGAYRADRHLFPVDISRMTNEERTALNVMFDAGYAIRYGRGAHILPIAQDAYDAHETFELELAQLEHESAHLQKEHSCTL